MTPEDFIKRWRPTEGSERANAQPFLIELCRLIGVDAPPTNHDGDYTFERDVRFNHADGSTSPGRIDLYRRGCFVLEAKQSKKRQQKDPNQLPLLPDTEQKRKGGVQRETKGWDTMMVQARRQAEDYAKALPKDHGWPPFLMIVDVGHVIELYADFSGQGKNYAQFPDRQSYRVALDDLADEKVRTRLKAIWTDPHSLDPARETAKVTSEIAEYLARLSKLLEARKNDPKKVAMFLMRVLFTMFAEDVGLIKKNGFLRVLQEYKGNAHNLHTALEQLWSQMDKGGFSPILKEDLLRFNGGLFKESGAVKIDEDELELLIIAAGRDWAHVEPAIFGTLLERALNPTERHKLGAHYTPRAYVERLVVPTIIEPLTEDWKNAQTLAQEHLKKGEGDKAREVVRAFHRQLTETRVLDPACGTGNFLYVSMELMKRLEGEVLETLTALGEDQYILELDRHTVDPHQFLGLELNPRAVAIAELVLWIGYLQWHYRTRGKTQPAQPVLKNFANIKQQDAVLAYDREEMLKDKDGKPLTRWDGVTKKLHPVTGEEVPDPEAQIPLYTYVNPRPAKWPEAEFIIGNPPFIGGKDIRQSLGDGYAEALWASRKHMPDSADFVMWWWDKAAELVGAGKVRRFGLITTNSITQVFSRRVIQHHLDAKKNAISLILAIPDHPWMKAADRAAVRIAMTVGERGKRDGELREVLSESQLNTDAPIVSLAGKSGRLSADLTAGADVAGSHLLLANEWIGLRGVCLVGEDFMIDDSTARELDRSGMKPLGKHLRKYINGRDLAAHPRNVYVLDFLGLKEDVVRTTYPAAYQWLYDRVRPFRQQNNRQSYRDLWWIFAEPRKEWREAVEGLARYIATPMTAKHRIFHFLSSDVLPDQGLVPIALSDGLYIGVLSSRPHVTWALAAGGWLGVGNDPRYNKSRCFDPFPFPAATEAQKAKVRALGEELDRFRKERLAAHPKALTMTGLYNVLEKLRKGEALTGKDKDIHQLGLVSTLKKIHDDLDAAVFDAYGWPATLSDEQILEKLVALNKERAAEEAKGKVRWLRPEFQIPRAKVAVKDTELDLGEAAEKAKKPKFPDDRALQVASLRAALAAAAAPQTPDALARGFAQGKKVSPRIADLLLTLSAIGQVREDKGRFFVAR